MIPRPYQAAAVKGVFEALAECNSTLVVKPTGTGKTITFAHVIQQGKWGRVMVLAHREELIRQAADKIERVIGEPCEIEMADERADTHMFRRARVVVSSIQTQIAGTPPRMNRFNPYDFGLVIVDEAHHAPADSYRRVLAHYRQNDRLKVLGVTATPDRSDEVALGKVFESVAYIYEITDAIRDGYLVPIRQKSVTVTGLDYSQARTTAGDLNQADIAAIQQDESILHQMVKPIIELAQSRKTIVFATPGDLKGPDGSFKIAERMTELLNRYSPESARRVSMDTPRDVRRQMLKDFTEGRFSYLVNVGVLTEGYDEPGVGVIAITRPTKSRALFAQMIGRGTRPLPGLVDDVPTAADRRAAIAASPKPHLEVLDFEGNAGRHKLVHTADVLGGNYEEEVVVRAAQVAKESGGDVTAALEEAKRQVEQEREAERERRRQIVAARAEFVLKDIDPFDVFDIAAPVERGWDIDHGLTEKQVQILKNNSVRVHENMTRRQASAIIGEIFRRRDSHLVGFKYAAALRSRGLPTNVTVGEAMNLMSKARKMVPI